MEVDTELNEESLFVELDLEKFKEGISSNIENNSIKLPLFYNINNSRFHGMSNLFSIYQESYFCILSGFYHSGIMLMSQLMEITLREIIFIHDNTDHQGNFEQLIQYIEGKHRKRNGERLLPQSLIDIFVLIKDDIRNPYMHLNYKGIFKGETIKGVKFPTGLTAAEIYEHVKIVLDGLKKGTIVPVDVDPVIDPIIAQNTKEQNDPKLAINLAWQIYPLFELLVDEYLTMKMYEDHSTKYGTAYDRVPLLELDV